MMEQETKEMLVFALTFLGVVAAIAGSVGISISIVKGIEIAIFSIPFWLISIPSFIFAFILKKNLNKKPTKE